MKLQMMTHGDVHQYEDSNGNMIAGYHSPESYYQIPPQYTLNSDYIDKMFTRTSPESVTSPPTTTTAPMDTTTSECDAAGTVNDDVLREAEEQLRPLIKEELRHTIQCKRVAKGLSSHVEIEYKMPLSEPETPAMAVKRQRRRDRNKIAAAKCRMKKKLISDKLMEESETLEKQNQKLRIDVQRLQGERQRLMYILNLHRPTCIVRSHQQFTNYNGDDGKNSPPVVATSSSNLSQNPFFPLKDQESPVTSPIYHSVIVRSDSVISS